jgi:glycerophosphoryl diester phosphodiesterase
MGHLLRIVGAVLLGAGLAAQTLAFELQGHRGARGLAPENTLAGFATARAIGIDTLELDTVITRDDVVVVSHDRTLNPNLTRDAAGRFIDTPGPAIRSLTLAEVQAFDVGRLRPGSGYAQAYPEQRAVDGQRIPSLAQLFEQVRAAGDTRLRFNIETKLSPLAPDQSPPPEAFARQLLAVIERFGMAGRVSVQSFDWRTLRAVQAMAPGIPTVYLSSQQSWGNNVADPRWTAGLRLADHGSVPAMVKAAGGAVWSPFFGDLSATLLAQARALDLKVVVWTVNEPAQIEQMLELGVDGIISDRPDLVRTALARRGMPLPPTPR